MTSPLVTMTSAPSLNSDERLNESQEVESGLSACSSSDLRLSGMEEVESGGGITGEMDQNPQSSIRLLVTLANTTMFNVNYVSAVVLCVYPHPVCVLCRAVGGILKRWRT